MGGTITIGAFWGSIIVIGGTITKEGLRGNIITIGCPIIFWGTLF